MDALSALRDRVDELEERLRQIVEAFGGRARTAWLGLRLTRGEWLMLDALSSGRPVTREGYFNRLDSVFPEAIHGGSNQIDVVVCRLRRKLRTLDPPIAIETLRGVGYSLDETNRRRLSDRRVV